MTSIIVNGWREGLSNKLLKGDGSQHVAGSGVSPLQKLCMFTFDLMKFGVVYSSLSISVKLMVDLIKKYVKKCTYIVFVL